MAHLIEDATTGRATCRGCGARIEKGSRRFGERVANPYADDDAEMTQWYHPPCAAYRRPEAFLQVVADAPAALDMVDESDKLRAAATMGVAHHRLNRVNVASLAPTGRATCRGCKQKIDKDTWRLSLLYYEDGRFVPSGYMHAACATDYLGTTDVMDRVRHFSPDLTPADLVSLERAIT